MDCGLFNELMEEIDTENGGEIILSNILPPPLLNIPDIKPTIHNIEHSLYRTLVSIEFHWCIKKGGKRGNQFWVYCEKSQNNYARITMIADGITLSSNSAIMQDEDEVLFLVEDTCLDPVKCIPLFCSHSIIQYPRSSLYPTATEKFQMQISLVADEEQPCHPHQEHVIDVNFSVNTIPVRGELGKPLSFFFEINFQGRAKGWFRLQNTIIYNKNVIIQGYSDTFMFNNPRMKKLPEHKKFSPKELKFMHLYSHTRNKQDFITQYHSCCSNSSDLFQKAEILFPKSQRCSLIRSTDHLPTSNEL